MFLLEIGSICTYYIAKFQDKSFVLYLCFYLCGFCVNKIFASRNQFSYGLYHLLVGLKSGLH